MADSMASPATVSATPIQTVTPTRSRKSPSAISGVKTTYIPVTKPVLETVVRARPSVWSA